MHEIERIKSLGQSVAENRTTPRGNLHSVIGYAPMRRSLEDTSF